MCAATDHRWQTCEIENCDQCQDNVDDGIVMACDGCCAPGHADADGWVMDKHNLVYCLQCAHELAIAAV